MSHQTPAAQGMASQSSEAASTAIPKGSIVLATSGNQKVPVDRLLLAANSSVFRDMLDLNPDNGEECPVAEKHADVLLFVNALEGEPAKDEATSPGASGPFSESEHFHCGRNILFRRVPSRNIIRNMPVVGTYP